MKSYKECKRIKNKEKNYRVTPFERSYEDGSIESGFKIEVLRTGARRGWATINPASELKGILIAMYDQHH